MNGRVYDYNLGRFLSVDPFIQDVGNSQGINPYSYIMNNPLGGTDPTGYNVEKEAVTGSRIKREVSVSGDKITTGAGNLSFSGSITTGSKNNGATKSGATNQAANAVDNTDKLGQDQLNKNTREDQNFGEPIRYDATANGGEFDSYTSEFTELVDKDVLSGDIEVSKQSITGETTAISILDGKITNSKEAKVKGLAISFVQSTDEKGQTTNSLQVASELTRD